MVCSTLENSFVYASFVQGHFVHRQVHLYSSCIVVKMQVILSSHLHWPATGLLKGKLSHAGHNTLSGEQLYGY